MSDELEILNDYKKDARYFHANLTEYKKKYGGNYVAVFREKLIAVNSDLRQLIKEIKKHEIDPSFVLIEFVTKPGVTIIF